MMKNLGLIFLYVLFFTPTMAQSQLGQADLDNYKTLVVLNSIADELKNYYREVNEMGLFVAMNENATCLETQTNLLKVLLNYKLPVIENYRDYSFSISTFSKLPKVDLGSSTIRFGFPCYETIRYLRDSIPYSEESILAELEGFLGPLSKVSEEEWDQIKAEILER
jgi:hypothetical protein